MFSITDNFGRFAGRKLFRFGFARATFSDEVSGLAASPHAFQMFDVMSVGSGGSAAQRFRGLPSTMVNLGGENWVFDVGEGTLRQLVQKYGQSVLDTTRIFITHMHMDHVMGLAALVAQNSLRLRTRTGNDSEPLHIYGPLGLHKFLCEIYNSTETTTLMNVVIHELVYVKEDEDRLWDYAGVHGQEKPIGRGGVQRNGRKSLWRPRKYFDQYPLSGAQNRFRGIRRDLIFSSESRDVATGAVLGHHWKLFETPKVTVTAGLIQHTAPCFGFVMKETDKAGPLDTAKIDELKIPRTSVLAELKRGNDVTLPDGRYIRSSDLVDPNSVIKGRKLVVLGDTNCASMLAPIAQDCDLLIHEATLLNSGAGDVISSRGHSTPHNAAETAKHFGAKRLLLNHISPQFSVGTEQDPLSDIQLQLLAGQTLGRPEHVIIARDFTTVSVPLGGYSTKDDHFLLHLPLYNGPLPKNVAARARGRPIR